MKRLIVKEKWKRHLAARSRSQLKANLRFTAHRRERSAREFKHARPKRFKRAVGVFGPATFSLVQNPEETIAFFSEMRTAARKKNVFANLSGVTTITPDVIIALLATIHACQAGGAGVSGNVPDDERAQQVLNDSGFRAYVRNSPSYRSPATMGRVVKRQSTREAFQNRFDQHLARSLVEFAARATGRPQGPSYSILCEAMLNTLNHAAKDGASNEPWWASVYYDSNRDRACFTFLDQGVGIFKSHRLTTQLRILTTLRWLNRGELLQKIFRGEIPSTTQVPGRGNGLPEMYAHCKAGRIKDFMVIANDGFGRAEIDDYGVLPGGFAGTLLYWEI